MQVWVKLKGRVKVLERVFLPQELYEIKCGKGFDDYILEYFRFKFLESLGK